MSGTPWTDERERVGKIRSSGALMGVVPAVYVRQLERELAEARAEIERKDKLIEQMRESLVAAKNDGKMQSAITYQLIRTAISAAERGE